MSWSPLLVFSGVDCVPSGRWIVGFDAAMVNTHDERLHTVSFVGSAVAAVAVVVAVLTLGVACTSGAEREQERFVREVASWPAAG